MGEVLASIGWSSRDDPSNRLGSKGLVMRIDGVRSVGVVAADVNVVDGLSGSTESRFRGLSVKRNNFLRPARVRRFGGDLVEAFGIPLSELGEVGACGVRGLGGNRKRSEGMVLRGLYPGDGG